MSEFFQEQREQSQIKSRIVSKYFSAWARVILATQARYPRHKQLMAYVDLFAGPGRYEDQNKSTPLLVLETIIANPDLSSRMVTLFNDKDATNIKSLQATVKMIEGINGLRYEPRFYNLEVGTEITEMFNEIQMVPTLFFVDPWGYKGLSLNLISSVVKDWGCDCIFFFNYNRVNMGLNNHMVRPHMISLFGNEQFNELRHECDTKSPVERENIIIEALCDLLRQSGIRFILPFTFKNDGGARTSHHLIFVSRSFRGYDIMKDIMYRESSDNSGGVASFCYNPCDSECIQGSFFDMLARPLEELQGMLLSKYAGRTISFNALYEEHSVNTPYVKKNYKDVLREMYDNKMITAVSEETGKPPRLGTFSEKMIITFGNKP